MNTKNVLLTNIKFYDIPVNTVFYYNKNTYFKSTRRTAILYTANRAFYFSKDTICTVEK